jgi:hypothetical protein
MSTPVEYEKLFRKHEEAVRKERIQAAAVEELLDRQGELLVEIENLKSVVTRIQKGEVEKVVDYKAVEKALNEDEAINDALWEARQKVESDLVSFIEQLVVKARQVETDPEAHLYGTPNGRGEVYYDDDIEEWLKVITTDAIDGAIRRFTFEAIRKDNGGHNA